MAKLYIGTSGWVYPDWRGIFYPHDLLSKDKLRYFSRHFNTVEINYSFYHLPLPTTYQKWYLETPANFVFSVKASRFITHIKRLDNVESVWKQFWKNATLLKEKLGPVLFQFPSGFKLSADGIRKLEKFLKFVHRNSLLTTSHFSRYAVEIRHKSWDEEEIYSLFKKYNVALVIADSPKYPKIEKITANFVYIRMHGSRVLFASKYTKKELGFLSKKIKEWLKQELDVYCYFNNDFNGYAVKNGQELLKMCGQFFVSKE